MSWLFSRALVAVSSGDISSLWASWPLLVLIVAVAWLARDKWITAQHARAAEVAASQAASASLAASVGDVATGLGGLRREVHELRGALEAHAEKTDARLRHHETGLGELRGEVGRVSERVDVLTGPLRAAADSGRDHEGEGADADVGGGDRGSSRHAGLVAGDGEGQASGGGGAGRHG